jgi:hypothetical protein
MKYGKMNILLGILSVMAAITFGATNSLADQLCTETGGASIDATKSVAADSTTDAPSPKSGRTRAGTAEGRHRPGND